MIDIQVSFKISPARWASRNNPRFEENVTELIGSFREAALLDGRRCTTHWSRTSELARRYPRARVLEDRLYVTDGERG